VTHTPRRTLPTGVIDLLKQWNAKELYANIEYEVDELRRDMKILELTNREGIKCTFVHDKLLVEPGTLFTQQGKPFAVSAIVKVVSLGGLMGCFRSSHRFIEDGSRH